jgi:hypothetical protein
MTRAPLRVLLAVLLLWTGVRAAILLPGWPDAVAPVPTAAAAPQPHGVNPSPGIVMAAPPNTPALPALRQRPGFALSSWSPSTPPPAARSAPAAAFVPAPPTPAAPAGPKAAMLPQLLALPAPPARTGASRWSASAWLLVRHEVAGRSLAPGGTLGGSQASTRLTYTLGGGFALSGRFYLPLRQRAGAEAAAGVDWRPVPSLPVNLLAERRQRLGRDGRNAFALTLYGGASRNLSPRLRLDLYGQAGVVGVRRRDLFADGSVRVARRLGPVELGAGAWGAAQPGAARLDAGPSLSWRLPIRDTHLRLQADWRYRHAGEAAPRSGPALTLAADF